MKTKKCHSFLSGRQILFIAVTVLFATLISISSAAQLKWYKGNLHAHSHWSDGDDYPEMVAKLYKEKGYHFLAISGHNILSQGPKWVEVEKTRGGQKAFDRYLAQFGSGWVEYRKVNGVLEARLKPLNEFRCLFEEPDRFLLIQAEEITDRAHLNGINVCEVIPPQGGSTIAEVLENNINAVFRQSQKTRQPTLCFINHPNFQWAVTAEDILNTQGARFFEVYNGHPDVRNYGDSLHAGTEQMWDIILTKRLSQPQGEILYAFASDDAHDYRDFEPKKANPGRGWTIVRADHLTPESIIKAMHAGDFYASTGVTLRDFKFDGQTLQIETEQEPNVAYTTQFVGTLKNYTPDSNNIGEILAEVKGTTAAYSLTGNEIYVRAKVISTKPKENPFAKGDVEVAWTQPVIPTRF